MAAMAALDSAWDDMDRTLRAALYGKLSLCYFPYSDACSYEL